MRILHTGDWHLGRTIGGLSRQDEFERVLAEVAEIARAEHADIVLVAGDIFDSFSPPPEAGKLFWSTIADILDAGARVLLLAGNHDAAQHMEAQAAVLGRAGVYSVGVAPLTPAPPIRIPSRTGTEVAAIAAVPWIPERMALQFETLYEGIDAARIAYREAVEGYVRGACAGFAGDTVNVFAGHVLVDGSEIGEGGGERKLHIGHNFAVEPACFPVTAQYVALGHIHKRQQIAAAAPAYYCGSLLQLDFGEGGQKKYVNIVDVHPGEPADVREVAVTRGRQLTTISISPDEIDAQADQHGDDYLRVIVRAAGPMPSLYERVREVLPNAIDVKLVRTDEPPAAEQAALRGLAPHELFARYYTAREQAALPEALLNLFNELYEEASHASA
jgi:exonuclease SbcD